MRRRFYYLHRLAALGVLTAMSLIVYMLESLLPPLFIPGAKLGLANLFSVFALILWTPAEGFVLLLARTILGGLLVGNLSTLLYSLGAGVVSLCVTALLLYCVHPRISLVCVSIVGAVVHNIAQNLIFVLLSATPEAMGYLPYLALIGVVSGLIVGLIEVWLVKALPASAYEKTLAPIGKSQKARRETL